MRILQSSSDGEASAWLIETCGVKLPEKENTMPNVIALKRPAAEAPGFEAVDIAERKIPVVKMPNTKKTTASTFISKKAAAQASAKQGFNVFPVWPYVHPGENATAEQLEAAAKQAKTPLIKNWQNQASQDPAQINAWWTEWPNAQHRRDHRNPGRG
jgi:hypothetical protein